MAGSSVITITSPEQLGDATRIVVKFPNVAVAQAMAATLLANGGEIVLYRSASAYNPDRAKAAREVQKALIEAARKSIETGRPATEFMSPELQAKLAAG